MLIEISEGEALDRVSILQIKKLNITDESRLTEINKELNQYDIIQDIKNKYIIYYKLLYYVNQKIWDTTNEIKELVIYDEKYREQVLESINNSNSFPFYITYFLLFIKLLYYKSNKEKLIFNHNYIKNFRDNQKTFKYFSTLTNKKRLI